LAVVAIGIFAFSVLVATSSSAHSDVPLVSTSPADIRAGQQLYIAHCEACHGVSGVGGSGPALVSAGAAAADFYLSTGRMPLNSPMDQPIRHRPYFNELQIRQLVAYVNALPEINGTDVHGPTIPTVLPLCPEGQAASASCVTLSQGSALFSLDCAQCHQGAGSGGMLSQGNLVPGLHDSTLTQVAEAARVGPVPMPTFGPGQLNEQQLSAIAHYVQYLQKPANRGGLPIGHFGPVPEGFVGILIGLGLLLLASRLIGTRG
jgi:ubiquinol-cytochrome c reductase cytochrome c subunit